MTHSSQRRVKRRGSAPVTAARRASIDIRALPSFAATRRAIGKAYSRGYVSPRSLRYAYAVLAVVVSETDWGRIPPGWAGGGRAFKKGFALYNARTALERLRARLEPLDFDVDYRISPPTDKAGRAGKPA